MRPMRLMTTATPTMQATVMTRLLRSFADLPRDYFRYSDDQPRDDDGRWTDEGGGGSDAGPEPTGIVGTPSDAKPAEHHMTVEESHDKATSEEFVSPSVASHLNFEEAVSALDGQPQAALRDASLYINGALGLTAKESNIVGAWADGAENSMMDVVQRADWNKLVLAGAMKGYIANQKQVLVFQQQDGGAAALYKFEAKGALADIHKNLLQDGLAFHTLVPHSGGATVYVADLDGKSHDAVVKGASRYDANVQVQFGKAQFLGTNREDGTDREQRDSARESYENDIRKSPVHGSAEVWNRVRDRWGEGLAQGNGVHASNPADALAVKQQWIARSPIKTREELFAGAPENKTTLDALAGPIADHTGARYKSTGNKKNNERVTQKLIVREPAGLTDVVRATFIVDSPQQADAVVAELSKVLPITDEGFQTTEVGYFDRAVNVHFANGQIGEVLIMPPQMAFAKSDKGGNGHGLYVEWRKPDTSPERKAELKAAQIKVYGDAYDKLSKAWHSAIPPPI